MSVVKLRASCDRCALDKVKCDKQRPSCDRCIQANRTCIYGVSQRAGKPPRAQRPPRHQTPSEDMIPPLSLFHQSESYPPPATQSSVPQTPNALTAPCWSSSDLLLPGALWQDDATANNGDVAGGAASSLVYDDLPTMSLVPSLAESSVVTLVSPLDALTPIGDFSPHPHAPLSPNSAFKVADEQPCCDLGQFAEDLCEIHALGKVKSMTLDLLLQRLASITQKITEPLTCPCTKDASLLMMLATNALEVLVLYQAVANVKDPNPRTRRRQGQHLGLYDGSLALGSFKLDEKTCSAVRDQLVLGQLHDMRETWNHYANSLSNDKEQVTEGMRLLLAITDSLLARLDSTVDEIESRRGASSKARQPHVKIGF